LDCVVLAAGVLMLAPLTEGKLEDFKHLLEVNLLSPFEISRAALPALAKTKGSLIFISSVAGKFLVNLLEHKNGAFTL